MNNYGTFSTTGNLALGRSFNNYTDGTSALSGGVYTMQTYNHQSSQPSSVSGVLTATNNLNNNSTTSTLTLSGQIRCNQTYFTGPVDVQTGSVMTVDQQYYQISSALLTVETGATLDLRGASDFFNFFGGRIEQVGTGGDTLANWLPTAIYRFNRCRGHIFNFRR